MKKFIASILAVTLLAGNLSLSASAKPAAAAVRPAEQPKTVAVAQAPVLPASSRPEPSLETVFIRLTGRDLRE